MEGRRLTKICETCGHGISAYCMRCDKDFNQWVKKPPVRSCHDCKYFLCGVWYQVGGVVCDYGHNPRHYMPRNGNPYDPKAGYKRRCLDFKEKTK